MLELTFWVGIAGIAFFCWLSYELDVAQKYEENGHPDECFMCNEGTCKGCPLSPASLSKKQQQQ